MSDVCVSVGVVKCIRIKQHNKPPVAGKERQLQRKTDSQQPINTPTRRDPQVTLMTCFLKVELSYLIANNFMFDPLCIGFDLVGLVF